MTSAMLQVSSLNVTFPDLSYGARALRRAENSVVAVDDVSLQVNAREIVGIVGESGSGKSTLCRVIAGLQPATAGSLRYAGRELAQKRTLSDRRAIQMIFQDPYTSLNPRLRIGYVLGEALKVGGMAKADRAEAAKELLASVGLNESVLHVRPSRLSGGQRQRVAIARALAVQPQVILADEVTSALDVSIQAVIVDLLAKATFDRGLTLVFVTHNLQVVRALCQRVVVLHAGRVVEAGPVSEIFTSPQHPYTRALLAAIPRLRRGAGLLAESAADHSTTSPERTVLPRAECHFRLLCPLAHETCRQERPALLATSAGHEVACHAVSQPKPSGDTVPGMSSSTGDGGVPR
jgi:oligopeptide/dipeptide ABC transporter ATP-binding protein